MFRFTFLKISRFKITKFKKALKKYFSQKETRKFRNIKKKKFYLESKMLSVYNFCILPTKLLLKKLSIFNKLISHLAFLKFFWFMKKYVWTGNYLDKVLSKRFRFEYKLLTMVDFIKESKAIKKMTKMPRITRFKKINY